MAAVQRDLRRVRRGNRRLQSGEDDEEVVFGLVGNADPQIAGLYFASVALGSPPQLFNVQVDTGSDLLWVACQPCLKCATRSQVAPLNPPFNASQSSSNHLLPCATRDCPRYHLSDNVLRGCPSPAVAAAAAVPAATCLYMLRYADGSASVGVLMRDVLHLPWTPSEQPVPRGEGGVAGVARRTSGNQLPGESGESGNTSELNIVEPRRIGQEVVAQRAAPSSSSGGAANNGDEAQGSSVPANSGAETQGSSANASSSGTKYRPVVTFGCGFNQSGNLLDGPLTVDGVMGLGRGASSLLAQLGAQHALPHAFAHCLGGPEGGGALFLGRVSSVGALSGVRGVWQQTALWDKPDSTQYMIGLAGIAVAGVPIAWQPAVTTSTPAAAAARDAEAAAAAAAPAAAPRPNQLLACCASRQHHRLGIASGTSLTYLPDPLYQTLTAALVQAIDLPLLAFAQTEGHFCYNLGDGRLPWPRARYLFPDLTLTFGTGARMVLPPENYILLLATTAGFEVPCIAWQSAGPDSSLAVLGDLALRNLLVEFDVEANTVRWLPSQCSQILHSAAQTTDPIDAAAAAADTAATAAEAFPESSDWLASLIPGLAGSAANPNQGGPSLAFRNMAVRFRARLWRRRGSGETGDSSSDALAPAGARLIGGEADTKLRDEKSAARVRSLRLWGLVLLAGLTIGALSWLLATAIVEFFELLYALNDTLLGAHDAVRVPFSRVLVASLLMALIQAALVGLAAVLTVNVAPLANGSGVPEIKGFLNGNSIPGFFELRTTVVKFLGLVLVVAAGMPVGREGPMAHIGAGDRDEQRAFVTYGGAAGVAAAFKAPIGGVLFMFEEVSSFWSTEATFKSFVSATISTLVIVLLVEAMAGIVTYEAFLLFVLNPVTISWTAKDVGPFLLLGVLGGLLSRLYTVLSLKVLRARRTETWRRRKAVKIIDAAVSALVVSLLFHLLPAMSPCISLPPPSASAPAAPPSSHSTAAVTAHVSFSPTRHAAESATASAAPYDCPAGHYNELATLLLRGEEGAVKHLMGDTEDAVTARVFPAGVVGVFLIAYSLLAASISGLAVPSGQFIPQLLYGAALGRLFGMGLHAALPEQFAQPSIYAHVGSAACLAGYTHLTISLAAVAQLLGNSYDEVVLSIKRSPSCRTSLQLTPLSSAPLLLPPPLFSIGVAKAVAQLLGRSKNEVVLSIKKILFLPPNPMSSRPATLFSNIAVAKAVAQLLGRSCDEVVLAIKKVPFLRPNHASHILLFLPPPAYHHSIGVAKAVAQLFGHSYDEVVLAIKKIPFLQDKPHARHQGLLARHLMDRHVAQLREMETPSLVRAALMGCLSPALMVVDAEGGLKGVAEVLLELTEIMDPFPFQVPLCTPILRVFPLMRKLNLTYVCVVDSTGQPAGLITRAHLIDAKPVHASVTTWGHFGLPSFRLSRRFSSFSSRPSVASLTPEATQAARDRAARILAALDPDALAMGDTVQQQAEATERVNLASMLAAMDSVRHLYRQPGSEHDLGRMEGRGEGTDGQEGRGVEGEEGVRGSERGGGERRGAREGQRRWAGGVSPRERWRKAVRLVVESLRAQAAAAALAAAARSQRNLSLMPAASAGVGGGAGATAEGAAGREVSAAGGARGKQDPGVASRWRDGGGGAGAREVFGGGGSGRQGGKDVKREGMGGQEKAGEERGGPPVRHVHWGEKEGMGGRLVPSLVDDGGAVREDGAAEGDDVLVVREDAGEGEEERERE
ncbi:unnamed protein product [Closterium sp. Yama58-4]|nr:unnamed protein product [Closterium sp. Yama58-4]